MGEMSIKTVNEDIYVMVQREERFKELVEEVPERYQNAEMYSVSIIWKRPEWIHNKSVIDFKCEGERFHGQYLMGWFIDKDNVDGLAKVADDYVKEYIAIPKEDRDVSVTFADAQSDALLNHFFEIAGIEVDDNK